MAACSNSLKRSGFSLPLESDLGGMVVGCSSFTQLVMNPLRWEKADFLKDVTTVTHQLACKPLLLKLPGHVRQLKLMSWYVEPILNCSCKETETNAHHCGLGLFEKTKLSAYDAARITIETSTLKV